MKISTITLIAGFCVVLVVTAFSFFMLQGADASVAPLDKANFVYQRSEKLFADGAIEKAKNGFLFVSEKYPNSECAAKSLETLTGMYVEKEDYKNAKIYYDVFKKQHPEAETTSPIRDKVKKLKMKELDASLSSEDVVEYVVKSGDTLSGIGKKFNTTVALIKRNNGLSGDVIQIGQKLKINVSTFSIIVDKAANILILKRDGKPFKTYTVATGRENSTPVGVFKVTDKMVEPAWTKPGVGVITADSEEYELGARWIPISVKGYGIHGTNDDSSIGKQSTSGCVRMYNGDVIELYDLIPRGTEVEIVNSL